MRSPFTIGTWRAGPRRVGEVRIDLAQRDRDLLRVDGAVADEVRGDEAGGDDPGEQRVAVERRDRERPEAEVTRARALLDRRLLVRELAVERVAAREALAREERRPAGLARRGGDPAPRMCDRAFAPEHDELEPERGGRAAPLGGGRSVRGCRCLRPRRSRNGAESIILFADREGSAAGREHLCSSLPAAS
jgi:hypothetical protein